METTDGSEHSTGPADMPLSDVTDNLEEDGYGGQFRAVDGGDLQCLTCRERFPASSQSADRVSRLEGASDPADQLVVVPLVCPACGAAGSWISSYGPEATAEDTDVLLALDREPEEGSTGLSTDDGNPNPDDPSPGVR